MSPMTEFAVLVLTTLFAAFAAVAMDWILLRAMFHLMRPATAKRSPARLETARGTAQLARALAAHR